MIRVKRVYEAATKRAGKRFLFGAKDEAHNNALALRDFLMAQLPKK